MALIELRPARVAPRATPTTARGQLPVLRDSWAGWRDGRRGLPVVAWADGVAAVEPSGHLLGIWAHAGQQIDRQYQQLLASTSGDRVEYAAMPPRRDVLQLRVGEYERRLAALLAAGPATDRRMGEDDLPESHVVRRRRAEHDQRLRRLRKQVTEARNALADLQGRQLELAARIEVALDAAQGDARVITVHADRRVASYLKGACRTHPDPSTVVAASSALRRDDPSWLHVTSANDLMNLLNGDDA